MLLKRGERIVIKPSVPMLLEKVTIEVQCTDSKNTSRPLQTSVTMTGATGHTVTLGTVSPLDQMELRTDIVLTEGHTYYLHTRGPGYAISFLKIFSENRADHTDRCVLIMGRFVDVNGEQYSCVCIIQNPTIALLPRKRDRYLFNQGYSHHQTSQA